MPVAAFCAVCSAGRAQTSGDPHNWDIAGIRLDISVDQAQAALHAHDPSMKVQVLESPSQIGKAPFTSGVVGVTGSQSGKSDGILITFTEMEGNKAYMIARVVTYDESSSPPRDVLMRQVTEKYGKPHIQNMWSFGPDGTRSPDIAFACSSAMGGNFVGAAGFSFPTGSTFDGHCGTGLALLITPTFWHQELAKQFSVVLVDGQLEYKNLMNIKKVHDDAEAKHLEEQRAKAEKQKSPF
jgi:hypothetical protein